MEFFENFDKTTIIVIVCVIAVALLIISNLKGNSVSKEVKRARTTKDVKPVIEAIDNDKSADVATVFNTAIKSLWDGYDRDLAMDLIKALLERNDKAPISQQWLQSALSVEPELARKQLGEEFIKAHFHEEIAQQCVGCGGSCRSCK